MNTFFKNTEARKMMLYDHPVSLICPGKNVQQTEAWGTGRVEAEKETDRGRDGDQASGAGLETPKGERGP